MAPWGVSPKLALVCFVIIGMKYNYRQLLVNWQHSLEKHIHTILCHTSPIISLFYFYQLSFVVKSWLGHETTVCAECLSLFYWHIHGIWDIHDIDDHWSYQTLGVAHTGLPCHCKQCGKNCNYKGKAFIACEIPKHTQHLALSGDLQDIYHRYIGGK